jgi:co-chaperonin GroES (HSP10)
MITHTDVPSKYFVPAKDLIMVRPRELPKGEVMEGNLVIEMEQNTSVVDRPTLGKVVAIGVDIDEMWLDKTIIWAEQDGIDVELQDGLFLFLQEKSVLGLVKAD